MASAWAGRDEAGAVSGSHEVTVSGARRGETLAWLLLLNLLDGLFTLFYLEAGLAHEANPVMRLAYEHSPLTFMGAKLGAVQLGGLLLAGQAASCRVAWQALRLGMYVYTFIVGYHVLFAGWLVWTR